MRNKKLISMLMLSAGFVACTQDEIVENNFAGIENQKDLVEDVILNVSLGENVVTRAEYAGDKDGNVFQQFYLEPAWNGESWDLTNNSALAGDQIGYVLANGADAIANYPFYLAGYGSAVAAPTEEVPNPAQKVWGLAAQDNYFYNLNWTGDFVVATRTGIEASVTAVKALQKKDGEYPALAVSALDVRKGIVRTHAGIMSGNYIAYYPYNAAFTEPGAVPAVGKMPLVSMYDAGELQSDRIKALERVSFYDRLFAIARKTNEVSGANKSGDVSIVPMTSALTIQFTNEDTEKASATIKRITLRAATEGVKPFILKGRVALDNLNVVTPESVEGATTDLIGASFTAFSLAKATKEGDKVVPTLGGLVTIPYMADPSVKEYIVEIYTTDGLIATKTVQPGLGLGVADFVTIKLNEWTFVPGTRKVFNEADFLAEVVSGGEIQLMDNIDVWTNFEMDAKSRALVITGDKQLRLYNGNINQPITMAAGHLYLGDDVTSAKKITAKHITLQTANAGKGITGDIEADRLDLVLNAILAQHLNVKELNVNQNAPKDVTLKWANIEKMNIGAGNTVTVNKDVKTGDGAYTHTVTVGEILNGGTLNVADLTVTTLNNNDIANVTGSLNATTINNDGNTTNTVFTPANFNVTGETNAATFNNVKANSALTWNSANKDMNLKVANAGIITVSAVKDFTGTVTNNGTVNLNEACNFKGTLDNNHTVNITAAIEGEAGAINNNAGTITVGSAAYLGLTTTKLNVIAGRVIVDGGDINGNNQITIEEGAEFVVTAATENTLEDALSSKSYNAKLTGIIVSATEWPETVTATSKKIYLRGNMTFPAATALNGDLVIEGTSEVTSTEGKLTVSAITINRGHSLTFAANSNVDVVGNITNNGTYNQKSGAVVWCAGIAGNGTWTKKPKY